MNSKHTPSSSDFKLQLNPNAKEFVPASRSRARESASARRQEPLVIKDQKSDEAFHQRLKVSRDYWELEEIPSYKKLKCATCKLNRHPKNYNDLLKELTHDVVNLVAYYHDCEDKDKEYECKYCINEFNGFEDTEDKRYACPNPEDCGCDDCEKARCDYSSDEDYSDYYDDEDEDEDEEGDEDLDERKERMKLERKRGKAYKKRNQKEHIKHLKEEHERKLKIILHFKQDFIPLCAENGFFGDGNCEWGVDDILRCMELNKGIKFLHMEEPPRPASPRSPKAWQYMMGMEDDDYDVYNYENEWDSDY